MDIVPVVRADDRWFKPCARIQDGLTLTSLFLGGIASHYYLSVRTVAILNENMQDGQTPVRQSIEDNESSCRWRFCVS